LSAKVRVIRKLNVTDSAMRCSVRICIKISHITGPRCPEGSRKLRFPDYVTIAQDSGKVVSLTHRPLLPLRKYSWYSFLLEAESTP